MSAYIRQIKRALALAIRKKFCPYLVIDGYGTEQYCYTSAEALSWLPACAPIAEIVNASTGEVLTRREQPVIL